MQSGSASAWLSTSPQMASALMSSPQPSGGNGHLPQASISPPLQQMRTFELRLPQPLPAAKTSTSTSQQCCRLQALAQTQLVCFEFLSTSPEKSLSKAKAEAERQKKFSPQLTNALHKQLSQPMQFHSCTVCFPLCFLNADNS